MTNDLHISELDWICYNLTIDSSHAQATPQKNLPASIGIARHLQPRPGEFFESERHRAREGIIFTYPVQANGWLISNTSSFFLRDMLQEFTRFIINI